MRLPEIHLQRNRILLIGTGSIMVSAMPVWAMLLRQHYGWDVRACLTGSAATMVAPAALAAATGNPVHGPEWNTRSGTVEHKELAEWADVVLIAPATGNFLAKCAHGLADDLASTVVAFSQAPVVIAPSLGRPCTGAVRRNMEFLREDGITLVPTVDGHSAFHNRVDEGAMPDLPAVLLSVALAVTARSSPEYPSQ